MTLSMDELFEMVTKAIVYPHTTIIEHDKRKAIQVFLQFDEYLMENVPEYCGDTSLGDIDFGAYAAGILDELEAQ
jgi:hypothetical protein